MITGDATGSVTEAGGVANGTPGTPTATGDLDADRRRQPGRRLAGGAAGAASVNGYGTYTLTAAGVWTYTLDNTNAAVQALNGAATLTDSFTATDRGRHRAAGDRSPSTAQNDAAGDHRRRGGQRDRGRRRRQRHAGHADRHRRPRFHRRRQPGRQLAGGAAGAATANGYGTYALTAAGVWTYTLDDTNAAVQALNGAATLTDSFTALTADGTAQLVTVTIDGAERRRR